MNISAPHPHDIIDPCNADPDAMLSAIVAVFAACFFLIGGVNFYRHSWITLSNKIMTWLFGLVSMSIGLSMLMLSSKYAPELYTSPLLSFMIFFNFLVARSVNNEILATESFMHGFV